jgi:hypothetical protein
MRRTQRMLFNGTGEVIAATIDCAVEMSSALRLIGNQILESFPSNARIRRTIQEAFDLGYVEIGL